MISMPWNIRRCTSAWRLGAAIAVLLACGCPGTAISYLRVRPAPMEAERDHGVRRDVEEIVREVATAHGLDCRPGEEEGEILECWPSDLGHAGFFSVHLKARDERYDVLVLEDVVVGLVGPRSRCGVLDKIRERIEARLPDVNVERDPWPGCAKRGNP